MLMAAANAETTEPSHRRGRSRMAGSQDSHCPDLAMLVEETERLSNTHDARALRRSAGNCAPNLLWREKVSQWCYDVVDHIGKSRDVVFIAMNILDRYCAVRSLAHDGVEEKDYEIYAMTALFLAFRVSGSEDLDLTDLLAMSRHGVQPEEIAGAGESMTALLSWEHRIVTPFHCLHAFLRSETADQTWIRSLVESASYLVEISVFDSIFSGPSSVMVALAALGTALREDTASTESSSCKIKRDTLYRHMATTSGVQEDDSELDILRSRLQHVFARSSERHGPVPHVIPFVDELDQDDTQRVCLVRSEDIRSMDRTAHRDLTTLAEPCQEGLPRSLPVGDLPACVSEMAGDGKRTISPTSGLLTQRNSKKQRCGPMM